MLLALGDIGQQDCFDCCVIGTGPAGITCALKLVRSGKRVLLLEGGGREPSEQSQNLYRGTTLGDPYCRLDVGRLRYFGGTSGHWGGWCRTLDAEDFDARPALDMPGWPITKADLDPYLPEASRILEIPEIQHDREIPPSGLKHINFAFSPPVRFGKKYFDQMAASQRIFLVLGANVTGFEVTDAGIGGVHVQDFKSNYFTVRANAYILAAGGIENSRLLLWSNVQTGGRTVRRAETLGRYWMDHPHCTLGEALIAGTPAMELNQRGIACFAPTPEMRSQQKILNCSMRVEPVPYHDAKRLVAELTCVAPELGSWAEQALGKRIVCGGRVFGVWEQEPNFDNRISLSSVRDALGVPRPVLHFRKSMLNYRTVQLVSRRLGDYLAQSNTGRIKLDPWLTANAGYPQDLEIVGHHHMGGTRMAASAAEGIVDSNCKVFGQPNLYIAGSSVFASGGHANPTLTIVQLALRLGTHLAGHTA